MPADKLASRIDCSLAISTNFSPTNSTKYFALFFMALIVSYVMVKAALLSCRKRKISINDKKQKKIVTKITNALTKYSVIRHVYKWLENFVERSFTLRPTFGVPKASILKYLPFIFEQFTLIFTLPNLGKEINLVL